MPLKKAPPKITPEEYIKKTMYIVTKLQKQQKAAADRMKMLNSDYVREYAPYKYGDEIVLPPEAQEGYDTFVVHGITPRIKPAKSEIKGAYDISFELSGVYRGFGKEDLKGNIIPQGENKDHAKDN